MSGLCRWKSFRSPMSPERADSELTPQSHNSIDELPPSSIVNLFNDAAGYREAIAESFEDRLSPPAPPANPALKSVQDFAELAGDDLEPPEHDIVGRFAQLAVEDWELPDGESYTEEPGAMAPDEHAEDLQDQTGTEETKPALAPLQTEVEAESELPLTPERVLSLLIEEFGPLAPAGEEKLLLEADGAVIQDVVILVRVQLLLLDKSLLIASWAGSHSSDQPSHYLPCLDAAFRPEQRSSRGHQGWTRLGSS